MTPETSLAVAVEIGERLLAEENPDAPMLWRYNDGQGSDENPDFVKYLDGSLYLGVSGIVHFLLPLYRITRDERYLASARRACEWMWRQFQSRPAPAPGLYIGQGGPTLSCLELFETTGDRQWLNRACDQAAWLADQPAAWMDLMNGPPGYGLLFLDLQQITGEDRWLDALTRCLDDVERTAKPYGDVGLVWPCKLNEEREWIAYGLAHGSAGVAVFLHAVSRADLPETVTARAAALGQKVDAALLHAAQPRDGGLDWTQGQEGDRFLVQWCHGAAGVGIAFLGSPHAEAMETARAAGRVTLAAGDNRNQASQCHGVCGNAETFIELYRRTGEAVWMDHARNFADMAQAHRLADQGPGAYRTHDTEALTFDLMTGIAGVGYFYLRAAHPDAIAYPGIGRWLQESRQ